MKRVLATILLMASVAVAAKEDSKEKDEAIPQEWGPKAEVLTDSFLYYHPDLKYRMLGLKRFQEGQHGEAYEAFRKSAKYADKASQAMVAEMLWDGIGVPADRVMAYVWMDLAAERGYKNFVVLRERYWARLSEAERVAAAEGGAPVYAEFGDVVAKPRMEAKLRHGRRETTGSRTGMVGNLKILIPGPGGFTSVDGSTYYAEHYWKPDTYFDWQDQIWRDPPTGSVEVGPLQSTPPPPPEQRIEPAS